MPIRLRNSFKARLWRGSISSCNELIEDKQRTTT